MHIPVKRMKMDVIVAIPINATKNIIVMITEINTYQKEKKFVQGRVKERIIQKKQRSLLLHQKNP